jgi:endoglucanase
MVAKTKSAKPQALPMARGERWLRELTALPTAAGREGRVIAWLRMWAAKSNAALREDRFGNLIVEHPALTRKRGRGPGPVYITAHLDHPAFVVTRVLDERTLEAEFRGGVRASFFVQGMAVRVHPENGDGLRGTIEAITHREGGDGPVVQVRVRTTRAVRAGDVMTWNLPPAKVRGGKLHAPACDDLAGVAAAVAAFHALTRKRPRNQAGHTQVKLLFTRAEEVGFLGAIAACKAGWIEPDARLICLENSKSFAESPLGGGPIVRVGDRTATFDPDLTYRCGRIAEALAAADPSFQWQRKLMPGGTCEASAFGAYGYTATCLCLPLGNYHNMNEATGRIAPEVIALDDFRGLVRLLVEIAERIDDPRHAPVLRARLDERFAKGRAVLG